LSHGFTRIKPEFLRFFERDHIRIGGNAACFLDRIIPKCIQIFHFLFLRRQTTHRDRHRFRFVGPRHGPFQPQGQLDSGAGWSRHSERLQHILTSPRTNSIPSTVCEDAVRLCEVLAGQQQCMGCVDRHEDQVMISAAEDMIVIQMLLANKTGDFEDWRCKSPSGPKAWILPCCYPGDRRHGPAPGPITDEENSIGFDLMSETCQQL
jgi:hypothetical protein